MGSGKTTFATRDKDAFFIDINEGGTSVTDEGSDVDIENYQHFVYVVNFLRQFLLDL
ncbi:AAA family ATPase [Staphylococcus aureus]|uniref:AAA family ATPase n=1 Tax=Staphylococcus aureus TaxID=1280 RepID=UPI003F770561